MTDIITSVGSLVDYKKTDRIIYLDFYLGAPGKNPAGLLQRMIPVGSSLFIPPKYYYCKRQNIFFLLFFKAPRY